MPKSWPCRCQCTLVASVSPQQKSHPPAPFVASAPWRLVRRLRFVSPTRPPCGLALLLGAGGWEYLPELPRWRPRCFGSKRRSKVSAALSAKEHTFKGAWRLRPGALAVIGALEGLVSPTRPPCGLPVLIGGGWAGQSLECTNCRQGVLAPRGAGGWGSCSRATKDGQRALAARTKGRVASSAGPRRQACGFRPRALGGPACASGCSRQRGGQGLPQQLPRPLGPGTGRSCLPVGKRTGRCRRS